ncbi:DNA primase TraC [Polystyrenella longa]|uniref:DNA primase TraC n=1 Tax=Polystyrenella longa TaxID=2528007 RepID=A0A518CNH4_9PLAN|nr:ArdC-like ssDNA-binding domain-containing protein [Polystyrenella longa]QDU80744.1 DNA primase TraC [Polystyrenella longa]
MVKQKSAKPARRDIYQEITDQILALLDRGTVPWQNPIRRGTGNGWPKNLTNNKQYRGINVFLLAMQAWDQGFGSDYWLTFRQAKAKGGSVRKGEQSSLVTFWKLVQSKEKETNEKITLPVLRHYNVFNVEQCEGIKPPDEPESSAEANIFTPIEQAEQLVSGYADGPEISTGSSKACYHPASDRVSIPSPERFTEAEEYYSTLFHELVHSTGHFKRLARGFNQGQSVSFGSPDYSKEELVAEMGAAFLNATAGISVPTIEQSAAYIDNWKKNIKGDKRLVVSAAGAAQRGVDWILGERPTTASEQAIVPAADIPPPYSPNDGPVV